MEGAPPLAALRQALDEAGANARPRAEPWSDLLGRSGRGRLAPAEGGLRLLHQCVLRSFATTGQPPTAADLAEAAAPSGVDAGEILAELHAADFLRLDAAGRVRAAYPFSAVPTPHRVQISAGPGVYAMCAIDALGMAAMLGTDVVIRSADPGTGTPVTVTLPADGGAGVWDPATTVVYAGRHAGCGTCPGPAASAAGATIPAAADVCCGYVNFFTTPQSATAWAEAHPEIIGQILDQVDAVELGAHIFGPLLTGAR